MREKLLNIFIKLIYKILCKLDSKYKIERFFENEKFTHVVDHNFSSLPHKGKKLFRTIPLEVWLIKTESSYMFCSKDHILFDEKMYPVKVKDCIPEKTILRTTRGEEKVKDVVNIGIKLHMYDVEIDDYTHMYVSNEFFSHNTTCACTFLLWKAIFNEDQTILIAANKMSSALEIMSRIRYIYEELPQYMKPGVKVYNKSSIEFDNNSRIISRATTPDAGRGLSVSLLYCLDPETKVTVRDKKTKEIKEISLKELYETM